MEAERRLRQFLAEQNESQSTQSEPIQSTSRAQFEPIQSTSRAQFERQKRFHTFPSNPSECWSEDRDNSERTEIQGETKTIFIRRIDCLLNANPIDQIEDKQSEDECIQGGMIT